VGKVLLSRGEGAAARGRFEEALPWCEGAWRARHDAGALEMLLRTRMYFADGWARSGDPARAAALYEALIKETEAVASGQAFAPRILAWTYDRLAQVLQQQGQVQASLPALRKGIALAERVARDAPDVRPNQRNVGVEYENLAAALRQTGDYAAGLAAVGKAAAIYEAERREDPADGQAALDVASAETGRADLLRASGRDGEALAAYEEALGLAERAGRANPDSVFAHALAAASLGGMGDIQLARREYGVSD
jgi:tetratricopeptide (TPR) repeat protein